MPRVWSPSRERSTSLVHLQDENLFRNVFFTGLGLGADQRIPTLAAIPAILVLMTAHARLSVRKHKQNLYLNIEMPSTHGGGDLFHRVAQTVAASSGILSGPTSMPWNQVTGANGWPQTPTGCQLSP